VKFARIDFKKNGPLLRISDAVGITGIDETTIREEIKARRLPSYRLGPKSVRINRPDLDRWAKSYGVKVGSGEPEGVAVFAVEDLLCRPVVYRLIARDGTLLYIGSTKNIGSRLQSHARVQPWWPHVKNVGLQHFKTIEDARRAEAVAIYVDRPQHNAAQPSVRPGDLEAWMDSRRVA
jgi:excisionase family DNA binding protein